MSFSVYQFSQIFHNDRNNKTQLLERSMQENIRTLANEKAIS